MSIPIAARIVAIADVFDALVFDRPYKAAWPLRESLAEISGQRDRHFDAALVDVFLGLEHAGLMSPIGTPGGRHRHPVPATVVNPQHPLDARSILEGGSPIAGVNEIHPDRKTGLRSSPSKPTSQPKQRQAIEV